MITNGETTTTRPGERADDDGMRHQVVVDRRDFVRCSTAAVATLALIVPGCDGRPAKSIGPRQDGSFWDDDTDWVD